MAFFSIAIPIYNVEKYINKCIDSILEQSFKDFEIICVDDRSSDNTYSILKQYAESDSRVKLYQLPENKGVSAARNKALDEASGQYLVWVDSDDWMEKGALQILYDKIQETKADLILYDYYSYNDKTGETKKSKSARVFETSGFYDITAENIDLLSDYCATKTYKLSIVKESNIRFPEGLIFEDTEFHFKLSTQITHIYYLNEALYYYRTREGSIVTNSQKGIGNVSDMFKTLRNSILYAIDKGLFHEYRIPILRLIASRVRSVKIEGQHQIVVEAINNLLEEIDFPNAFLDLENNLPEANFTIIRPEEIKK